jgi:formylglycine-generating enzyme required for sulfatase activity
MGTPYGDGRVDEYPQHAVTVAGFCMQKSEVTVADYAACASTNACPPTPTTARVGEFLTPEQQAAQDALCNGSRSDRANHPMNCINADQAAAYCRFAGGRLPSEEEWEFAARGTEGRLYPWGKDAPTTQVCWKGAPGGATTWSGTCPVAQFTAGDTPLGIHDLAGDVWEWTTSPHCPYSDRSRCLDNVRSVRGGGWEDSDPGTMRAAGRSRVGSGVRRVDVGFRCVR